MTAAAGDLLAFLDLEQIDRDIFRGSPGVWPDDRDTIFGGHVAAQALRAAAHTVPEGRLPHSLHGYYLRRGDRRAPVVYMVDRDRDGRSFSARRVAAVQGGEVIWEMACSFDEPVDGPAYAPERRPGFASPDESPRYEHEWCPLVDIRVPPPPDGTPVKAGAIDRCWTRVVVPVPDHPVLQACLLAFTSDIPAGFGSLAIEGIPPHGPSIDHSVWFHGRPKTDEWVLYDCTPMKITGHRGLYQGAAYDEAGNLLAMLAQEMLLRPVA
ncbi:MAG: acyl-CoA thioesterase domain-containing protein [Ilumatobacteraceae bacterium]